MISNQPSMCPRCWTKPGIIPMKNFAEKSKKLYSRNLPTWTNNRYGKRGSKAFCPQILGAKKNKWVLKIKGNSVCWACLIACGYSQVPVIDFSKNYSLVDNDITFCILLLMVINFGYSAKIFDIETEFSYGNLEEEIYVECPQSMSDVGKDICIILNKCVDGLV